jgi:hypothetical protein
MAKFDSNKHKLPDTKDANAVRNHIKAKYTEKKYYKKSEAKESDEEERPVTEDESSEEDKKKKKKSKNKEKKEEPSNVVLKPVVNNVKLNPLSIKKNEEKVSSNKKDDFDPSGFEFTDSKKNE